MKKARIGEACPALRVKKLSEAATGRGGPGCLNDALIQLHLLYIMYGLV